MREFSLKFLKFLLLFLNLHCFLLCTFAAQECVVIKLALEISSLILEVASAGIEFEASIFLLAHDLIVGLNSELIVLEERIEVDVSNRKFSSNRAISSYNGMIASGFTGEMKNKKRNYCYAKDCFDNKISLVHIVLFIIDFSHQSCLLLAGELLYPDSAHTQSRDLASPENQKYAWI